MENENENVSHTDENRAEQNGQLIDAARLMGSCMGWLGRECSACPAPTSFSVFSGNNQMNKIVINQSLLDVPGSGLG